MWNSQLLETGTTLLYVGIAILASLHVILHKRDSRAAVGWLGLIWLSPFVGAFLYYLLGINRLKRKAIRLRRQEERLSSLKGVRSSSEEFNSTALPALRRLGNRINDRPLLSGNKVTPLLSGDEAYPRMLQRIESATRTIALSTYIFDNDSVGQMFVSALAEAALRGVKVRVLFDDIGSHYSFPSIRKALSNAKIPSARFLPPLKPIYLPSINLRNHRKSLVVDGECAFLGGLNIREGHWLSRNPKSPVADLHFEVEGPVVGQVQDIFREDWKFATREELSEADWTTSEDNRGTVCARAIADGPDEDFEKTRWLLIGALGAAQKSVQILAPYFLPDAGLTTALASAALRGVAVEILLPGKNNLPYLQWATQAILWQFLEKGCRIWYSPPPFDHSKLMVVDREWALFGSSNWDPRSLRLNFELNLECYDRDLAQSLAALFEARRTQAREISLKEVDGRSLPVRVRDGVARLFSPYL